MNKRTRPEGHSGDPLKTLKRSDYRKAFGRAGDDFHDRVRQTLFLIEEKEDEPVKKKMTFAMALACALCLCIMATALAASMLGSDQPDVTNPLSQGDPAQTQLPPIDELIMAQSTPTPMPMPTTILPTPAPVEAQNENTLVYSAADSSLYHLFEFCEAFNENILHPVKLAEALRAGKVLCPVCMPSGCIFWPVGEAHSEYHLRLCSALEEISDHSAAVQGSAAEAVLCGRTLCSVCEDAAALWSPGDRYTFHLSEDCLRSFSDEPFESAPLYSLLQIGAAGCPLCASDMYYCLSWDTFYHADARCAAPALSGLMLRSEEQAIASGRTPCPDCASPATQAVPVPTPTPMPEVEYVWSAVGDESYHLLRECFAARQGLLRVSLAVALNRQQAPCRYCIVPAYDASPVSTPTPMPTITVYSTKDGEILYSATEPEHVSAETVYYTPHGLYYHTSPNCSGTQNAIPGTIAEALNLGKQACPVCRTPVDPTPTPMPTVTIYSTEDGEILYSATEPEHVSAETVYYTPHSEYYHTSPNCNGMRNALPGTIAEALNLGKQACPVCRTPVHPTPTPMNPDMHVYMTDYNGRYYHYDQTCMNMAGAYYNTLAYAMESFEPCPLCVEKSPEIYLRDDGTYFHLSESCIPYGTGYECGSQTVEQAMELGRTPCPMCYEPSSRDISYWMSEDSLYHASLQCSRTHTPSGVLPSDIPSLSLLIDHSFLAQSDLRPCPDCVICEPLAEQKDALPASDIPLFLDAPVEALDAPNALVFTARGFFDGQWDVSGGSGMDTSLQGSDCLTVHSVVMTVARGSLYLEVEFEVNDPSLSPDSVRFIPYSEESGSPKIEYAVVREFTYDNGKTGYLLCQLTQSPSDEYGEEGYFRIYGGAHEGDAQYIADFR